ncbi:SPOR domain-containing protein, partial [Pseudomonas mosselii]|uniref:SPOR domain-containing protein n=1 Tax=Pseudomonas mosselii TaxID=78327 RepID=UPI0018D72B32
AAPPARGPAPSQPIAPVVTVAPPAQPKPQTPVPTPPVAKVEARPVPASAAPAAKPAAPSKIDANGLPVSWSIQLASLSNRAGAENLQKTLRSQGYNAYIRSADGMNRVFVGPLIERAEAERLRDVINRQQNLKGIVVRFQPERG